MLRWKPELLGHELPGESDRVALEVIAEAEVAEHLEERVVAGGMTDLLEVVMLSAGAHALLHGRRAASARWLLLSKKNFLELHHPGVGEHERRIVGGHDGRAGVHDVTPLLEILDEFLSDLGSFHLGNIRE